MACGGIRVYYAYTASISRQTRHEMTPRRFKSCTRANARMTFCVLQRWLRAVNFAPTRMHPFTVCRQSRTITGLWGMIKHGRPLHTLCGILQLVSAAMGKLIDGRDNLPERKFEVLSC